MKIESYSYGKMAIGGQIYGKDLIIFPVAAYREVIPLSKIYDHIV
ncbi:MAG: hypothetical protein Q7K98_06550 [Candidatus Omnitrophota bacterium]|nr:hypothetical protein [Candidatus Omnitrophota bacterium]